MCILMDHEWHQLHVQGYSGTVLSSPVLQPQDLTWIKQKATLRTRRFFSFSEYNTGGVMVLKNVTHRLSSVCVTFTCCSTDTGRGRFSSVSADLQQLPPWKADQFRSVHSVWIQQTLIVIIGRVYLSDLLQAAWCCRELQGLLGIVVASENPVKQWLDAQRLVEQSGQIHHQF